MVNGNNKNRQLSVSRVFAIIVKLKCKCYRENVVYSFDKCARLRKQCLVSSLTLDSSAISFHLVRCNKKKPTVFQL
jgi:hypothetical protein